jgi:predicted amidohydrolase
MKVATISLNQVWEDKGSNLLLCEQYIKEANLKGVDLIIFPEMTLTGFSTNIQNTSEGKEDSKTIDNFKTLAKLYDIAILFGVVIKNNEKALNKGIFIDNQGDILGEYAKIHPFSFSGESKYFDAGESLTFVKYKDLNIGLSICYDLRFPELYSALAKKSDIIINIANWPKKRVDHWNTLLKARAIENQLYVCGVNRIGVDGNNLEYKESSQCISPNGEFLVYEQMEDMKIYNIDKKLSQEFRKNFNTINDRKIKLYKEII